MSVEFASNYTQRTYRWQQWKNVYLLKGLPLQFAESAEIYSIWTYDGPEVHLTQIWKNSVPESLSSTYSQTENDTDKLDFESNFKASGNLSISQIDSDGAQIVRNKAAKKGWTYGAVPIEFTTSKLNSTFLKTESSEDRNDVSILYYDANGVQVTDPALESTICQTIVDFEPHYDYEVIGGAIRTLGNVASDVRLWIIAVPDVPVQYGGSKQMCSGLNLRYLAPSNMLNIDGRVSKFLTYSPVMHTNKLRMRFDHAPGAQEGIMIVMELYRQ